MDLNDFDGLQKAYTLRGIELHQLHERLSSLEEEIAQLKELLKLQQQRLFGKKSEASGHAPTPPENMPGSASPNDVNINPGAVVTVGAHSRRTRGKRQLDTSNLPRYTLIHDLSEDKKACECCGGMLHFIGKEVSEQLEIIPARYCVIEHVRMKYGCRPCESIIMAPKPEAPLPKAIAGASLLTDIILSKYQYHLPLYRQSKIMSSYNVTISDKTLANWVTSAGEALFKVYDALWAVVVKASYLQVDETPVKQLDTDSKGYIWSYLAPEFGNGLLVYEFSETRSGSVAAVRLKEFNGLLQTDGYSGYTALRKREGVVGFGCLSHARRKFSEVIKISGDKYGLAAEMQERMKPLYALEARMREAKLPHRTRKRLRQKITRPLLKDIHKWLRSIRSRVLPKSKLGKAIEYTLNQWPYLIAYLRHGMAEIDTNDVENKIRQIALGKKNWLFIGNKDSGKIHALWFSLIISSVMNNINPRVYIHYLISKIHAIRRGEIDPTALLPDRIDCDELQCFAMAQISLGKKMMDST
jgi:transposase